MAAKSRQIRFTDEDNRIPLILFKTNNFKTLQAFSTLTKLCNNLYISIVNESESCHNPNLQRDREYREDGAQGFFAEA